MSSLVLAGYFPKRTALPEDWDGPPVVREICSVSQCLAEAPDNWIDRCLHNTETWLFDRPELARQVIPPGEEAFYSIFAYGWLPIRFLRDRKEPLPLPSISAEPLPAGFRTLGFDVVSWGDEAGPTCSPLSCNSMACEVPVNQYCLVGTLAEAVSLAERCARQEPEPGPYRVIEVLRDAVWRPIV